MPEDYTVSKTGLSCGEEAVLDFLRARQAGPAS